MKSPEIARRDLHAEPPGPHDQHAGHKGHEGHDKHAGHSVTMFRERFWLSLALSVPTLVWSPSLQDWLGFSAPSFPLSEYVPPLFGTAVFFTRTPEETAACRKFIRKNGVQSRMKGSSPGIRRVRQIEIKYLIFIIYTSNYI